MNTTGAHDSSEPSGTETKTEPPSSARSTVANAEPDTCRRPKAPPVPDHQTDAPTATGHVQHDLQNEGDRISCRGCKLNVKAPDGYRPEVGRAYEAWDKELR